MVGVHVHENVPSKPQTHCAQADVLSLWYSNGPDVCRVQTGASLGTLLINFSFIDIWIFSIASSPNCVSRDPNEAH